jgi:uncharacterized membrane protein HdeD (DUF308 family)
MHDDMTAQVDERNGGVGAVIRRLSAVTALVVVLLAGAWAVVTGVLEIAGVNILARPDVGAIALATVPGVFAPLTAAALLWAAWHARKAGAVVPRVGGGPPARG